MFIKKLEQIVLALELIIVFREPKYSSIRDGISDIRGCGLFGFFTYIDVFFRRSLWSSF